MGDIIQQLLDLKEWSQNPERYERRLNFRAEQAKKKVIKVAGIKDIVAKSLGSSNSHNVVRACMEGLANQLSPKNISILRGKKISEITEKRG